MNDVLVPLDAAMHHDEARAHHHLALRSSTLGQITELATPVSSSMVMNTTPCGGARPLAHQHHAADAHPRAPSRVSLRSAQEGMRFAGDARLRGKLMGWAFRERRSVR